VTFVEAAEDAAGVPIGKERCVFRVGTDGKVYYLLASTSKDRDRWVEGLNRIRGAFQDTTVVDALAVDPKTKIISVSSDDGPQMPEMKGMLGKKGGSGLALVRDRHFVLAPNGELRYYKDQSDKELMGSIHLRNVKNVRADDSFVGKKAIGCGFVIVTKSADDKDYELQAPSPAVCQQWVTALSTGVEMVKNPHFNPNSTGNRQRLGTLNAGSQSSEEAPAAAKLAVAAAASKAKLVKQTSLSSMVTHNAGPTAAARKEEMGGKSLQSATATVDDAAKWEKSVSLPQNWDDTDDSSDLDEEEQAYVKGNNSVVAGLALPELPDLPGEDEDDELDPEERAYVNSHKGVKPVDVDFDSDLDEDEIAFLKARK